MKQLQMNFSDTETACTIPRVNVSYSTTKLIKIEGVVFKIQSYSKDERSHILAKNEKGITSGFILNFKNGVIENGYGKTTGEWIDMKNRMDINKYKRALDSYFEIGEFTYEQITN